MSEEERLHLQQIEDIISRKVKPIYWAVGIMVAIFVSVSAPLTSKVIDISSESSKFIKSDEAYKNFLPKGFYHQLQKDEHKADLEALKNPSNAEFIYMRHNDSEADRLDIRYRGTD